MDSSPPTDATQPQASRRDPRWEACVGAIRILALPGMMLCAAVLVWITQPFLPLREGWLTTGAFFAVIFAGMALPYFLWPRRWDAPVAWMFRASRSRNPATVSRLACTRARGISLLLILLTAVLVALSFYTPTGAPAEAIPSACLLLLIFWILRPRWWVAVGSRRLRRKRELLEHAEDRRRLRSPGGTGPTP